MEFSANDPILVSSSRTSGGKAYLHAVSVIGHDAARMDTYQDQNAIMNPNQEKKKTRP